MNIKPNTGDLENWSHCVPRGDLVFFRKEKLRLAEKLPYPSFSREQTKAKGIRGPWTLNSRSWYGYALNQADYCTWMPEGALEKLEEAVRCELAKEQSQLQVPTIINGSWITSLAWSQFSSEKKVQIMDQWIIRNEVYSYESFELDSLPEKVKEEIESIGFKEQLNSFAAFSGPNCFATTAASIQRNTNRDIALKWMHWPELESHLRSFLFEPQPCETPEAGDVLIFSREAQPIHAAYFLGEGYYFEKPGQDFYEPYRIDELKNSTTAWENSTITCWRKVR